MAPGTVENCQEAALAVDGLLDDELLLESPDFEVLADLSLLPESLLPESLLPESDFDDESLELLPASLLDDAERLSLR